MKNCPQRCAGLYTLIRIKASFLKKNLIQEHVAVISLVKKKICLKTAKINLLKCDFRNVLAWRVFFLGGAKLHNLMH